MQQEEVIKVLQELNANLNAQGLYLNVSAVSTSILRINEAYEALEAEKE